MIKIFQRHCNFSSNSEHKPRPEWFDREKIFDSFINTLDERVEYTAFHDCGNGDIKDHFLNKKDINKISLYGGNDAQSFLNLLNYIIKQDYDEDDIIYFVEDDYLHRENWCEVLIEAFSLPTQYVSLYDHLDKYIDSGYDNLESKVFFTDSCHWRTVPSTCNTYAGKMGQLKQDMVIHKHFSAASPDGISMDHAKFVELGRHGRRLITPMPGYSTHCDLLHSPTIDWEKYING